MARTIHEVLHRDRELYPEFRNLLNNPERLDEMSASWRDAITQLSLT